MLLSVDWSPRRSRQGCSNFERFFVIKFTEKAMLQYKHSRSISPVVLISMFLNKQNYKVGCTKQPGFFFANNYSISNAGRKFETNPTSITLWCLMHVHSKIISLQFFNDLAKWRYYHLFCYLYRIQLVPIDVEDNSRRTCEILFH